MWKRNAYVLTFLMFSKSIWCFHFLNLPFFNAFSRYERLSSSGGEPTITDLVVNVTVRNRYAHTDYFIRVKNPASRNQEYILSIPVPSNAYGTKFFLATGGKKYRGKVIEYVHRNETDILGVTERRAEREEEASCTRFTNRFVVTTNLLPHKEATFKLEYEEFLKRENGQYEIVVNIQPKQFVENMYVKFEIMESIPLKFVSSPIYNTGNDRVLKVRDDVKTRQGGGGGSKNATIILTPSLETQKQIHDCVPRGIGIDGQIIVQYDVERQNDGGELLIDDDGYYLHLFGPEEEGVPILKKKIVFTLDTSKSMEGRRIEQLKLAMKKYLKQLDPDDLFHMATFNWLVRVHDLDNGRFVEYPPGLQGKNINRTHRLDIPEISEIEFPPWMPATPEYIEKADNFIQNVNLLNGTNIYSALLISLGLLNTSEAGNQSIQRLPMVIFLTDGTPTVDTMTPYRIINRITKRNENTKYPIHTVSLGNETDKFFLEELSVKNYGQMKHVYEAEDTFEQLTDFFKTLSKPLYGNIKFAAPAAATSKTTSTFMVHLSGMELIVTGKLDNRKDVDPFDFAVTGWGANGHFRKIPVLEQSVGSLERAWAYLKIKEYIQRNSTKNTQRAVNMALQYGFLTPVTAMYVQKVDGVEIVQLVPGDTGPENTTEVPITREENITCANRALKQAENESEATRAEQSLTTPCNPICRNKPIKLNVKVNFKDSARVLIDGISNGTETMVHLLSKYLLRTHSKPAPHGGFKTIRIGTLNQINDNNVSSINLPDLLKDLLFDRNNTGNWSIPSNQKGVLDALLLIFQQSLTLDLTQLFESVSKQFGPVKNLQELINVIAKFINNLGSTTEKPPSVQVPDTSKLVDAITDLIEQLKINLNQKPNTDKLVKEFSDLLKAINYNVTTNVNLNFDKLVEVMLNSTRSSSASVDQLSEVIGDLIKQMDLNERGASSVDKLSDALADLMKQAELKVERLIDQIAKLIKAIEELAESSVSKETDSDKQLVDALKDLIKQVVKNPNQRPATEGLSDALLGVIKVLLPNNPLADNLNLDNLVGAIINFIKQIGANGGGKLNLNLLIEAFQNVLEELGLGGTDKSNAERLAEYLEELIKKLHPNKTEKSTGSKLTEFIDNFTKLVKDLTPVKEQNKSKLVEAIKDLIKQVERNPNEKPNTNDLSDALSDVIKDSHPDKPARETLNLDKLIDAFIDLIKQEEANVGAKPNLDSLSEAIGDLLTQLDPDEKKKPNIDKLVESLADLIRKVHPNKAGDMQTDFVDQFIILIKDLMKNLDGKDPVVPTNMAKLVDALKDLMNQQAKNPDTKPNITKILDAILEIIKHLIPEGKKPNLDKLVDALVDLAKDVASKRNSNPDLTSLVDAIKDLIEQVNPSGNGKLNVDKLAEIILGLIILVDPNGSEKPDAEKLADALKDLMKQLNPEGKKEDPNHLAQLVKLVEQILAKLNEDKLESSLEKLKDAIVDAIKQQNPIINVKLELDILVKALLDFIKQAGDGKTDPHKIIEQISDIIKQFILKGGGETSPRKSSIVNTIEYLIELLKRVLPKDISYWPLIDCIYVWLKGIYEETETTETIITITSPEQPTSRKPNTETTLHPTIELPNTSDESQTSETLQVQLLRCLIRIIVDGLKWISGFDYKPDIIPWLIELIKDRSLVNYMMQDELTKLVEWMTEYLLLSLPDVLAGVDLPYLARFLGIFLVEFTMNMPKSLMNGLFNVLRMILLEAEFLMKLPLEILQNLFKITVDLLGDASFVAILTAEHMHKLFVYFGQLLSIQGIVDLLPMETMRSIIQWFLDVARNVEGSLNTLSKNVLQSLFDVLHRVVKNAGIVLPSGLRKLLNSLGSLVSLSTHKLIQGIIAMLAFLLDNTIALTRNVLIEIVIWIGNLLTESSAFVKALPNALLRSFVSLMAIVVLDLAHIPIDLLSKMLGWFGEVLFDLFTNVSEDALRPLIQWIAKLLLDYSDLLPKKSLEALLEWVITALKDTDMLKTLSKELLIKMVQWLIMFFPGDAREADFNQLLMWLVATVTNKTISENVYKNLFDVSKGCLLDSEILSQVNQDVLQRVQPQLIELLKVYNTIPKLEKNELEALTNFLVGYVVPIKEKMGSMSDINLVWGALDEINAYTSTGRLSKQEMEEIIKEMSKYFRAAPNSVASGAIEKMIVEENPLKHLFHNLNFNKPYGKKFKPRLHAMDKKDVSELIKFIGKIIDTYSNPKLSANVIWDLLAKKDEEPVALSAVATENYGNFK